MFLDKPPVITATAKERQRQKKKKKQKTKKVRLTKPWDFSSSFGKSEKKFP